MEDQPHQSKGQESERETLNKGRNGLPREPLKDGPQEDKGRSVPAGSPGGRDQDFEGLRAQRPDKEHPTDEETVDKKFRRIRPDALAGAASQHRRVGAQNHGQNPQKKQRPEELNVKGLEQEMISGPVSGGGQNEDQGEDEGSPDEIGGTLGLQKLSQTKKGKDEKVVGEKGGENNI